MRIFNSMIIMMIVTVSSFLLLFFKDLVADLAADFADDIHRWIKRII